MKSDLLNNILNDMRVELADEFDRNFTRGGFFGKTWQEKADGEKSTLQQGGRLRRSLRATTRKDAVVFSSSEKYAAIHNEGGEIEVTPKMRRFFWAKYYSEGKKSAKAQIYKGLALKKVGSKITIPKRRYIGDDPQVRKSVETIVRDNMTEHLEKIEQTFKSNLGNA